MIRKIAVFVSAALLFTMMPLQHAFARVNSNTPSIVKNNINSAEKYLEKVAENANFHGSVFVAQRGKTLISKGYGFADYDRKVLNTPNTKFAIGSITKQFTALSILQLQQRGLLNVKDRLSKYIPDFPGGDKITIHNLLTHTSGISSFADEKDVLSAASTDLKVSTLVDVIKKKPLELKPGEKYLYSNAGYLILTYIIERLSKMSYGTYLQKNIFTPLGMKNTGLCYNGKNQIFSGKGYIGGLTYKFMDCSPLLKIAYGAGSLYSTTGDLYLWERSLNTEKLIPKQYLDMMFTGYADAGKEGRYGYGWMVSNTAYGKKIAHGGTVISFTSEVARYVDKDLMVIVLTNGSSTYLSPAEVERNVTSALYGGTVNIPQKRVTINSNPALYSSFEGAYDISPNNSVKVFKNGSSLFAVISGQSSTEIFPEAQDKFYSKEYCFEITFNRDTNGKVNSIILDRNGKKNTGVKKSDNETQVTNIKIDEKTLDALVGEYSADIMPGLIIKVTKEGNNLFVEIPGYGKYQLVPISDLQFTVKVANAKVTFVKDKTGKIVSAIVEISGMKITGKKVK